MSSDVQIVLTAVDKASAVLNQAGQQSNKLASGLVAAAKAAGVATLAYKGMEILKTTVLDTVAYAEQVRNLSRALGINAEESSKLLQIADDLKIDQTQLAMAFRFAINKGIDPSINGLKKLQTEYNQIQDPIEKARFAMENFGTRGGLEMQKVLELTGEELDEMAKSARDAGLILSDEAVQSARDFEIAVDNLNDRVEGLKIEIGTKLIPVINDLLEATDEWIASAEATDKKVKIVSQTVDNYSMRYVGLNDRLMDTIIEQNNLIDVIDEAAEAAQGITADMNEQIRTQETLIDVTDDLSEATKGNTAALDGAIQRIKDSNLGMAAKIELEKELKRLTGELTAEEEALDEALGFLTKQLELGNLKQEEYIALVQQLNEDATLAAEIIKGLGNAILLLPDSKDIHINIKYHKYGKEDPDAPVVIPEEPEDEHGGRKQFGGPVMQGRSYLVGERGPELFTPDSAGNITNYWNLTINEAGSRGNVVMDFALLQALARG